jgi:uncharacterized membrane protein
MKNLPIEIKIHTLLKGIIWEALGVLILGTYLLYTTGKWSDALSIGVGYPLFRAFAYYPYERIFKRVQRKRRAHTQ